MRAAAEGPPTKAQRGRPWAWLPVGLLGGLLGTQLIVLANVLDDPHFSVEPNYYRKSVQWDAQMRQRARGEQLGWKLALEAPARASPAAPQALLVRLRRADGSPLSGADIFAEAFHLAHASTVLSLNLEEAGAGEYQATLPSPQAGLWEFRLRVKVGSELFQAVRRQGLHARGAGALPAAPSLEGPSTREHAASDAVRAATPATPAEAPASGAR